MYNSLYQFPFENFDNQAVDLFFNNEGDDQQLNWLLSPSGPQQSHHPNPQTLLVPPSDTLSNELPRSLNSSLEGYDFYPQVGSTHLVAVSVSQPISRTPPFYSRATKGFKYPRISREPSRPVLQLVGVHHMHNPLDSQLLRFVFSVLSLTFHSLNSPECHRPGLKLNNATEEVARSRRRRRRNGEFASFWVMLSPLINMSL